MYKQQIIDAILSQRMLKISFRRESDDNWVSRDISPYDVFPKENKNSGFMEDILFGYAEQDYENIAHPVLIYLNNIQSINELSKTFDGSEIRRLLKVKKPPYVTRSW